MKYLKLAMLSLLFISFLASCEKDENISEPSQEQKKSTKDDNEVTKESISAKWVVSGNSEYKSFEFNESGNYIIVKEGPLKSDDNEIVLYGTYEVNSDGSITIDAVGVISVTFNGDNTIDIELALLETPDVKIPMSAEKVEAIAVGTKTEMLCQSWRMESVNDSSTLGTIMDMTVIFTEAGTYFVTFNLDWETYLESTWLTQYNLMKEMFPDEYSMDFETYKEEMGFAEALAEMEEDDMQTDENGKWRWKDDSQTTVEFWDHIEDEWDTKYPLTVDVLTPTKLEMSGISTLEYENYNVETGEYEWVVEEQGTITYVFGLESQYVSAPATTAKAFSVKMPSNGLFR